MKPGQLSEHFYRDEFSCPCNCGFDTVDAELIRVLETTHSYFSDRYQTKARIIINSGCRCQAHNSSIGGAARSVHMLGKAADIVIEVYLSGGWVIVHADDVSFYLNRTYTESYGIGRYYKFTHLDVRSKYARWDKRI